MKTKSKIRKAVKAVRKDIAEADINFTYQPKHTGKKFKFPTTKRVAKQYKKFINKERLIEQNAEL